MYKIDLMKSFVKEHKMKVENTNRKLIFSKICLNCFQGVIVTFML